MEVSVFVLDGPARENGNESGAQDSTSSWLGLLIINVRQRLRERREAKIDGHLPIAWRRMCAHELAATPKAVTKRPR